MSVNLYWRPKRARTSLEGKPATLAAIKSVFGDPPVTLSSGEIPILRGMQAANPENPAWEALIDAVDAHNSIIVEAEW